MTDFKEGDIVNVRCVVVSPPNAGHQDPRFTCRPVSTRFASEFYPKPEDVELIHHSFSAGDRVEYVHVTGQHRAGYVEHISGQFAWVNLGNDHFDTVDLADLTPAAPQQAVNSFIEADTVAV